MTADQPALPWHACPIEETLRRLETARTGLDREEAERRLAAYGPNLLETQQPRSPLARFLAQFNNILIYVLLGSAVVTAGLASGSTPR